MYFGITKSNRIILLAPSPKKSLEYSASLLFARKLSTAIATNCSQMQESFP